MDADDFNRKMGTIVRVVQAIPGAIDVLDENARKVSSLVRDFRETHWGSDESMHATTEVHIPNVESGIVALGPLLSVVYLATKRGKTFEWEHRFEGGYRNCPILSYAHDGSGLVVVRGSSSYTVTKRGIEG